MFKPAISLFVFTLCSVIVGAGQVIPNGSFDRESADANLPAYYRARATTKQYHSYDPSVGHKAKGSGLFDTGGKEVATGYFYGFYDEEGVNPSFIAVQPGDRFTMSVHFKMDANFHNSKRSSVFLQAIFYQDAHLRVPPQAQIDSKRASIFDPEHPETWSLLTYDFEVPKGVSHLGVGVYFNGNGKVWVDDFTLIKKDAVSAQAVTKQASGDSLSLPPFSRVVKITTDQKPRLATAVTRFETLTEQQGTPLQDSVWTLREADCHPQIRLTANVASAVLNSASMYPDGSATLKKAYNALDWLMRVQESNGSFSWYRNEACSVPIKDEGALMYEGSIAMIALRDGYLRTDDQEKKDRYYKAAGRYCDFLLTVKPHANTNFNAFAMWALSSFITLEYNEYEMQPYLLKLWQFYEHIEKQQTTLGNWPDYHNRHIWYHAIISRGLASLYAVQNKTNAYDQQSSLRLKQTTYRAINYMLAQIRGTDGSFLKHPETPDETVKSPFPLEVVLLALEFPGLSPAERQHLEQLSALMTNFKLMSSQGHEVAALGRYLHYKEN